MAAVLHSWRTLVRHLTVAETARDLLVLTVVGGLASFSVLFTSRVPYDNVLFEAGLTYDHQSLGTRSDAPGAIVLTTRGGLSVEKWLTGPAGPRGADHTDAVEVTTFSYPEAQLALAGRLVSGVLTTGSLTKDEAAIDEATAARLDVRPGDQVALWWASGDVADQAVTVSAVTRPYHPTSDHSNGGLVLLSDEMAARLLPGFTSTATSSTTVYSTDGGSSAPDTKAVVVRKAAVGDVSVSTLVALVFLIGVALWLLGVQRVVRSLRDRLGTVLTVMVDLGQRPIVGRLFVVGTAALSAVAASLLAALGARQFILGWTGMYVTSSQVTLVTFLLTAAAVAFAWIATRRSGILQPGSTQRTRRS